MNNNDINLLNLTSLKIPKRTYRWHAIYTRSRSEKKLYNELQDKGLECYLPLVRELKVWSDRKKWVDSPLFRSYVFVKVSDFEYYNAINSTWASRYVCFEGKAVSIPESQINSLKILLENSKRNVELTFDRIRKGDQLDVVVGPLKGIRGEVLQLQGKHRIILRFANLGCCVLTNISLNEVQRVEHQESI